MSDSPTLPDHQALCTQCGGELRPDQGQIFLTCPYCSSTVYLDKSQVVFHWYLAPTLDENQARQEIVERTLVHIPLACLKCNTALPAQPDEVAWVCARCGQGLLLDESAANGHSLLEIQYASVLDPNRKGLPFWVVEGSVQLDRTIFAPYNDNNKEAELLWSQPRRFFIPASDVPLQALADMGLRLLLNPPALQPGPTAPFEPVTVSPADLPALDEFIVLAIEAARSDMLKQVNIQVRLSTPALWVLPWGQ